MSSSGDIKPVGAQETSESSLAWTLVAIAIFFARSLSWAMSEYWYDEVLTFGNFVLDPNKVGIFQAVFRSYPIANNHILSSAIYAIWTACLGYDLSSEFLVRLPSIIEGAVTILIISLHWRKWLGVRVACIGAIVFAISPVFTAFAYQVRGYSLSMMLATAAISGALECVDGKQIRGLCISFICCVLLPLTIPSNALVAPIVAAVILVGTRKILPSLVPLVGGFIGGSYYFTIWEQFVAAAKEPSGWDSAVAVALHLLLAFSVHLAVILVCIPFRTKAEGKDEAAGRLRQMPLAIAGVAAIIICAVLFLSAKGRAPYPRVFLVFLPIFSFSAFLAAKDSILSKTQIILPLLAVFAIDFGVEKLTSDMTQKALAKGESPFNLLQQYYRGSSEIRVLAQTKFPPDCIIITDEYDLPTMELYNLLNGRQNGLVVSPNKSEKGFATQNGQKTIVLAIAKTPEIAAYLLSHAGFGTQEELLDSFTDDNLPDQARMRLRYDSPDTIRQIYAPPIMRRPTRNNPPQDGINII